MNDWRHRARCRTEDPELFFPFGSGGTEGDRKQIAKAKAVCKLCPVSSECLDWSVRTGQDGIWGGLTVEERRPLRRRYLAGSA